MAEQNTIKLEVVFIPRKKYNEDRVIYSELTKIESDTKTEKKEQTKGGTKNMTKITIYDSFLHII